MYISVSSHVSMFTYMYIRVFIGPNYTEIYSTVDRRPPYTKTFEYNFGIIASYKDRISI